MALTKVIGAGLGEIPAISGANLTNLDASDLTGTLPAISGTNLTNLDAADLTGNLPAISGASLTGFTSSQMPAGSIVQLIQAQTNTPFSTSSASFTDTGFSGSITPTSSSNKIYIIAAIGAYNTAANGVSPITIYRGSTRVSDSATYGAAYGYSSSGSHVMHHTITFLDTPNTTSSTEYKIYTTVASLGGTAYISVNNSSSTITLMELAV